MPKRYNPSWYRNWNTGNQKILKEEDIQPFMAENMTGKYVLYNDYHIERCTTRTWENTCNHYRFKYERLKDKYDDIELKYLELRDKYNELKKSK